MPMSAVTGRLESQVTLSISTSRADAAEASSRTRDRDFMVEGLVVVWDGGSLSSSEEWAEGLFRAGHVVPRRQVYVSDCDKMT